MLSQTKDKNWFIYVVVCFDNSLYCGITTDIERRLNQHNGRIKGGAKYTRSRRPVKLEWSDICKSRSDALKREYKFKKMSRKNKLKFIGQNNNNVNIKT